MLHWNTNEKSYVAYRMISTPMTLSDTEGHFSYYTPS